MIPDHLTDKAETAAIKRWGETGSLRDALAAALAVVAADIWDQGWDVGRRLQGPNSNPYNRNEHA